MRTRRQLVGRAAELAQLEGALERLDAGTGAAIALSGEPGIGKTRLLAEAAALADGRGHLVLDGRATELESDFPFGVMVDALDDYLAALGTDLFDPLSEDQRRHLAAVFPALSELAKPSSTIAEERFRSHRAVRALLELLAGPRPCVVVLDDVHWADDASIELLDHLLRHPPTAPVLLLFAHRSGQAPAALVSAARAGGERIELQALGSEDAHALLGSSLETELRERLFRESGGNPFYLEQLSGAVARGTFHGGDAPRAVADALAEELAGLAAGTRLILHGAAVAGEPFTPDLAAGIAEVDEREALAGLDEAIALGLIRATDTPMRFRFRHPIVRQAVYASAGQAWVVGAHRRAADLLQDRGAAPVVRAHHVERSAREGDPAAIALLAQAGRATAALAPATAARWYAAALRLLPDDAEVGRQLELLAPLAAALGASGRLEQARETLLEMLALLPEAPASLRGRLIGFAAIVDRLLGRHGDARELLENALADLDDPAPREAAALHLELAADRFFPGDWAEMDIHAERAWVLASQTDDPGLRATAAGLLGLSAYSLARMPEARERMEEARALVDDERSPDGAMRLDSLDWLGWLELSMEEYGPAIRHLERGLEVGRRSGGGHLLTTMSFGLVLANTWSGHLPKAVEHSDTTIDLARLSGSDQVMSWALGLRALVALQLGELDEALTAGEEALRLGDGVGVNPFSAVNAAWLGEARVEAGDPTRGRDEILTALGGRELPAVELAFRPHFYGVLAGAEVARGDREAASVWALLAAETAAGLELPGRTGAALTAAAVVALADDDPARGARLALQAAGELDRAHPIDAARARMLEGRCLAAAGERAAALRELHLAETELRERGALRYAAHAVRELRRLGERIGSGGRRRTATTGEAALSAREHEVADLVTERLTNRQIAERLVLSEKTIERHLSSIFRKLDARTRVDVARTIERGRSRPVARRSGAAGPS